MAWRIAFLLRALLVAVLTVLAVKLLQAHPGHEHGREARAAQGSAAQPVPAAYRRSLQYYIAPDVTLVTPPQRSVRLRDLMAGDGAVVLNFVSAACAGTCREASDVLAALPAKLGPAAGRIRLVSVSIDPVHEAPAALPRHAQRHGVRASWHFLSGAADDIASVRQAFAHDARHLDGGEPLMFLRIGAGEPWVRIEGRATADDLAREYRLALMP